jgi:hypothetical protein
MSASAKAWAETVDLGPRSDPHEELLVYMAWRMNHEDGKLCPSVPRIIKDLRRSERSIQYSRRFLESVGLLEQHRQGRGRTCRYTLHVGRTPNLAAAARRRGKCAPQDAPSVHLNGAKCAPQSAQSVHPEPRQESNQEGEPRECAPQAAAPAQASPPVDKNLVAEKGTRPVSSRPSPTLFPEDIVMLAILAQMIRAAGLDPELVLQSMSDWCADRGRRSADWLAFTRRWIARELKRPPGAKPAKPDRYTQTLNGWGIYLAKQAEEARP